MIPSLIIFDWDYTLVGVPCVPDEENRIEMASYYADILDENEMKSVSVYEWSFTLPVIGLKSGEVALPGSKNLLEYLHSHDVKLAVVSNKHYAILRHEMDLIGWGKYFSAVIGREDPSTDAKPKPAPDMVDLAIAQSGVSADDTMWFVGDSLVDALAGNAAGCVTVYNDYIQSNKDVFKEVLDTYGTMFDIGNGGGNTKYSVSSADDLIRLFEDVYENIQETY